MLALGAKDMREPPRIPAEQHATSHAQRREVRRMPNLTAMVNKRMIAPDGMLRRAAALELYPNCLVTMEEYVVITPLEVVVFYVTIDFLKGKKKNSRSV